MDLKVNQSLSLAFVLNVGAKGLGWTGSGNHGQDGGIGFAIITLIEGGS